MDAATSEGDDPSPIDGPGTGPTEGARTSTPGQRLLFLAGTALFVVGIAVVVGVQGTGSIAPSPPAINDSTPANTPQPTATPGQGGPEETPTQAPTASPTPQPTATPTDDGGLFGDGNDTQTPTDGDPNNGGTPTPTDDGGLFGDDNDTQTPTPSSTSTPTPTDDGGLFGGDDTPTPSPTPTPTPSQTQSSTSTNTSSDGPNADMTAFIGVWPLLRGLALPLVTALLGAAMLVTTD